MMLPVEVHILSGSSAIAVEAHAVQLALQAGFGLAHRAVPRPREHQTHSLNSASIALTQQVEFDTGSKPQRQRWNS